MDDERPAIVQRTFRLDLVHWIATEPRTALRVMRLVEDSLRTPFEGIGKPEPLRGRLKGRWSRRITKEHRIIYAVEPEGVSFLQARYHYTR